uniref:Anion exchange protein n=2 Tax=Clastoptera arizonana TaxID=38151 RepID=A0A1B6CZY0_9HEMI
MLIPNVSGSMCDATLLAIQAYRIYKKKPNQSLKLLHRVQVWKSHVCTTTTILMNLLSLICLTTLQLVFVKVEMKEETYMSSSEDLTKKAAKESIMKRIPSGAEATTVLVGAVDFLKQPTIAFVRLAEGILIPSITEVPLPVRFLFILMGPLTAELDYHEIGRSISTLMSIADFHTLAYKATERSDLLIAINEFLDYSIVLPPGDWQTKALLPFAELKAKTEAIRRRQSRVQDAAKLETKAPLIEGEREKKPPYPDPLKRTKRPYGGLVNDIKRRFPFYISDIIDGVNAQCFAAAIFIYFAALSAAITFGGLMADKTNNLVGISETLLATSGAGIIFSLLAGQPLVIVGTTGPLLLFDESLYNFCQSNGIEYLTIRVYIGFWLAIIALVVAFFEGSVFVKLFTRFISEIFASLISLLYIMESAQKVYLVFIKHPLMTLSEYCSKENITNIMYSVAMLQATPINSTDSTSDFNSDLNNTLTSVPSKKSTVVLNEPNTALFCLILALGTFFIAYYLRQFRNSKFLGRSARRALGDFGVPIAIVMMVFGDYIVPGIYTEKLKVPEGLSPSNPVIRGWIISPLGLVQPFQLWVALAASIPAILVYILLFMETHISELIIDKKDRKLKKGSGFHLDIVLICLINVGSGLIGAPFMCAATVRSVAHVSAVTVMSRTHAPGDKPHIIEVKEQRLSALVVSVLVGVSVLMSPLLRLVPMAVLFGVFLYMGISSIDGIQFFERLRLFFMPVKHHEAVFVRRVRTMKMHLFTTIQLMCLVILWIVKSSSFQLAFPFFLILMVPLRAQFCYIFTPAELRALDSDEPDADGQEDEPDFYAESLLAG